VFGLSMDYEVFLVSRMHERWRRTHEHSHAVADGLSLTGRVVTAAAAIMVCVFLSFTLLEARVVKEFGLSLASAVLLDALVVRCLLLPAVLHLVGRRTWSLPAWLERLLPRLNIEGTITPTGTGEEGARASAGALGTHPRRRAGVATEGAEA
ncbi:MAG TPA: MMPL family transporter, partial [Solirubrobacteraceae bacterium]|nr:MMPL family transporter [Solirubrobacteraceae bacterium]